VGTFPLRFLSDEEQPDFIRQQQDPMLHAFDMTLSRMGQFVTPASTTALLDRPEVSPRQARQASAPPLRDLGTPAPETPTTPAPTPPADRAPQALTPIDTGQTQAQQAQTTPPRDADHWKLPEPDPLPKRGFFYNWWLSNQSYDTGLRERQRDENVRWQKTYNDYITKFPEAIYSGNWQAAQALQNQIAPSATYSTRGAALYQKGNEELQKKMEDQYSKKGWINATLESNPDMDQQLRTPLITLRDDPRVSSDMAERVFTKMAPNISITPAGVTRAYPMGGESRSMLPTPMTLESFTPEARAAIEAHGGNVNQIIDTYNMRLDPNPKVKKLAEENWAMLQEKYQPLIGAAAWNKLVPPEIQLRTDMTPQQWINRGAGGAPGGQPGGIPPAGQPTARGAPESPNANVSYAPQAGKTPGQPGTPQYVQTYGTGYEPAIMKASQATGIRPELLRSLMAHESAGDPSATGKAKEIGLFQLTPTTAQNWVQGGVKNARNNDANIMGGAQYLKMLLDRFGGNEELAVAAYNAGPEAVIKAGYKVPQNDITPQHVRNVLGGAGAPQGQPPPAQQPPPTQQPQAQAQAGTPPAPGGAPILEQIHGGDPGVMQARGGKGPQVMLPRQVPPELTSPSQRAAFTAAEERRYATEMQQYGEYWTKPDAQGRVAWWRDAQGNLKQAQDLTPAQLQGNAAVDGVSHPRLAIAMANENNQFLNDAAKFEASANRFQRFLDTYLVPGHESFTGQVWESIVNGLQKGIGLPKTKFTPEMSVQLSPAAASAARLEFNAVVNGLASSIEKLLNESNHANIDIGATKAALTNVGTNRESAMAALNGVRRYVSGEVDGLLGTSNAVMRRGGTPPAPAEHANPPVTPPNAAAAESEQWSPTRTAPQTQTPAGGYLPGEYQPGVSTEAQARAGVEAARQRAAQPAPTPPGTTEAAPVTPQQQPAPPAPRQPQRRAPGQPQTDAERAQTREWFQGLTRGLPPGKQSSLTGGLGDFSEWA